MSPKFKIIKRRGKEEIMKKQDIKKILDEKMLNEKLLLKLIFINKILISFDKYEIEDNQYICFYIKDWLISTVDMEKIEDIR